MTDITSRHADPEIQSAIADMNARIDAIRTESEDPLIGLILDRFVAAARPFCPGVFRAQDPADPADRFSDLIGGWPYTSDDHPWPLTGDGALPMQPLVQLRLADCGRRLGLAAGDGLLQVWGPAFTDFGAVLDQPGDPFLTRIIGPQALTRPPSVARPAGIVWHHGHMRLNVPGARFLMNPAEDCEFATTAVVDWQMARPMFGTFPHLYNCLSIDEQDAIGGSDAYWPIAESIDDRLADSPLSMHQHSVYLGGLSGAAGGAEDPGFDQDLLIRLQDGDGFHFAVTVHTDRRKRIGYAPVFRIRS